MGTSYKWVRSLLVLQRENRGMEVSYAVAKSEELSSNSWVRCAE